MNSPVVSGWLCVAIALACAGGAVDTWQNALALRDRGVRTVAEVVDVHETHRSRSSYVVLRFRTADGREVTADVGNYRFDPEPRAGDRPEIVYDPYDPDGNVADARTGPDFFTPWALVAGTVAAAAFAVASFTGAVDWREWS